MYIMSPFDFTHRLEYHINRFLRLVVMFTCRPCVWQKSVMVWSRGANMAALASDTPSTNFSLATEQGLIYTHTHTKSLPYLMAFCCMQMVRICLHL